MVRAIWISQSCLRSYLCVCLTLKQARCSLGRVLHHELALIIVEKAIKWRLLRVFGYGGLHLRITQSSAPMEFQRIARCVV